MPEEHETWLRRLLIGRAVRPIANVARPELIEVVRRAIPQNGYADFEGRLALFDANVPLPLAIRYSRPLVPPSDLSHTANLITH
jgi:hypothetical protein